MCLPFPEPNQQNQSKHVHGPDIKAKTLYGNQLKQASLPKSKWDET